MEKIVRLSVTSDVHRALKVLAAERAQSMQVLLTEAVAASPITQVAFKAPGTYTRREGKK